MKNENEVISEKEIVERIKGSKQWHHDIKYIDGVFVEDVVKQWQETNSDDLLDKIIANYSIFRGTWAKAFAPYLDNDLEAGMAMHDQIIWRSAFKFKMEKSQKGDGKAFNAYVVSALLNQLKNQRNAKMSHKNHPRVTCPVCNEQVYQIDQKHLKHLMNFERYKKMFPNYPLVSTNGQTICPATGEDVNEVTQARLNKLAGSYSVEDFKSEYARLMPAMPVACPVTGTMIDSIDAKYPSNLMKGYAEDDFLSDFPDFPAIKCPFSGKRLLEMTQAHLDGVLLQKKDKAARSVQASLSSFKNLTLKARRVNVMNPYTGKFVPEITLAMLSEAGVTWKEHLEKFAAIILDKYYPGMVTCPFTGRRTHEIKTADVLALGKTVQEFYSVACKYPLRKWEVKCALCGEWVSNVWDHIEKEEHSYAPKMEMEEFEGKYGTRSTKIIIRTNSYVENDAGDCVHVADLFPDKTKKVDFLEVEDSLLAAAEDDLDKKIASVIRDSHTLEDVCYSAAEKKDVELPFEFKSGLTKEARDAVRSQSGLTDFDIAKPLQDGAKTVSAMVPSRDTIRRRLLRMIESSDLTV